MGTLYGDSRLGMQAEIRYKALEIISKFCCMFMLGLTPAIAGCADTQAGGLRAPIADRESVGQQLYLQYGALALRKRAEGNPDAAGRFSFKAEQARLGANVPPEPATGLALNEAQRRLTAALADPAASADPAVTARAQVMYDCWLDEYREGVDAGDIKACKQEFERALQIMSKARAPGGRVLQ